MITITINDRVYEIGDMLGLQNFYSRFMFSSKDPRAGDIKKEIMEQVLRQKQELKQLINSRYDVILLAANYPEHADDIIQLILEDEKLFTKIFCSVLAFYNLSEYKTFSKYKKGMIEKCFKSKKILKQCIRDHHDVGLLVHLFPGCKSDLLEFILGDEETLGKVVKNLIQLRDIIQLFDDNHKELLMGELTNRGILNFLVEDISDLDEFARKVPDCKNMVMKYVLQDQGLFNKVFTKDDHREVFFKRYFSKLKVLRSDPIDEITAN